MHESLFFPTIACETKETVYEGKRYILVSECKKSWYSAAADCAERFNAADGSGLVVIPSADVIPHLLANIGKDGSL